MGFYLNKKFIICVTEKQILICFVLRKPTMMSRTSFILLACLVVGCMAATIEKRDGGGDGAVEKKWFQAQSQHHASYRFGIRFQPQNQAQSHLSAQSQSQAQMSKVGYQMQSQKQVQKSKNGYQKQVQKQVQKSKNGYQKQSQKQVQKSKNGYQKQSQKQVQKSKSGYQKQVQKQVQK